MNLKIKLFADGANLQSILKLSEKEEIKGFTTNPTLMKKDGVQNYKDFAKEVLYHITSKPISFEVFSDDISEMKYQAYEISSWAKNVYVKIPITNTKGISTLNIVDELSHNNVKVNVTGVFTVKQSLEAIQALKDGTDSVLSVFAGRIADTGVNPSSVMSTVLNMCSIIEPKIELLWASPRELYNIVEADNIGCHIITVSHDLLNKLHLFGKNLEEFSLETVKMFYDDARKAGYYI